MLDKKKRINWEVVQETFSNHALSAFEVDFGLFKLALLAPFGSTLRWVVTPPMEVRW